MKAVRAQFARRLVPGPIAWWLCVGLLGLAASLTWLAWQSVQRTQASKLDQDETALSAQRQRVDLERPAPPPVPPPYDSSAREMLVQATTPWPALLAALEAVQVYGVRLVSVDYVAVESRARVEIAFVNHAAALEYVEALAVGMPETGAAWRWRPLLLSQPRSADKGAATLEAIWQAR